MTRAASPLPKMFSAVRGLETYALCGDAPLLRELGIDPKSLAGPARIRLEPVAGTRLGDLPQRLEPKCP